MTWKMCVDHCDPILHKHSMDPSESMDPSPISVFYTRSAWVGRMMDLTRRQTRELVENSTFTAWDSDYFLSTLYLEDAMFRASEISNSLPPTAVRMNHEHRLGTAFIVPHRRWRHEAKYGIYHSQPHCSGQIFNNFERNILITIDFPCKLSCDINWLVICTGG
jgi:hypothetical protein